MSTQIRAFTERGHKLPDGSYSPFLREFFLHFCLVEESRERRLSNYFLQNIFSERHFLSFIDILSFMPSIVFPRGKILGNTKGWEIGSSCSSPCRMCTTKAKPFGFPKPFGFYFKIGTIIPIITRILGAQIKSVEKLWKHKEWLFFCVRGKKGLSYYWTSNMYQYSIKFLVY